MSVNKPIVGTPGGYDLIEGTGGNDFIVAYGPFNTIYTNGGADFIDAGDGGATVILAGSETPEPPGGTTTVNLQGTGNVVQSDLGGSIGVIINDPPGPYAGVSPVYTGAVSIVGYAGRNTVALGEGRATIDLGGQGNTVLIGGGEGTIRLPGTGYNNVTVGGAPAGPEIDDTIILAGLRNVVENISFTQPTTMGETERAGALSIIGGAGNGTFTTAGANTTLRTTGTGNTVDVGMSGTSTIAPGDGQDTVDVGADSFPFIRQPALATVAIVLKGQHNTVSGSAKSLTITGGDGHGTYDLTGVAVPDGVDHTYSVVAGGLFNNFTLDDTDTNTIFAGFGYGTVTLRHPVSQDRASLPTKLADVTLYGNHNTLTGDDGPTIVKAGGYGDTITLGNGDNNVTSTTSTGEPGANTITLGSGHNRVSAANGDTLHLNGGTDAVYFGGLGLPSMVFLGGGVNATINGYATDVDLDVLKGNVSATLRQLSFREPPTIGTIILEKGTVTGGTVAQVLSSLHDDGHGGTALSLAGGGVLDFVGAGVSSFSAADFILRS